MMGTPANEHPDCLWQQDEEVIVEKIVRDIRRIHPQVVVTFDPWGGYGHPDHIYMHRATTKAFHAAGDPARYPDQIAEGLEAYQPAKLYYNTFPRLILQMRVWKARLSGQNPRQMGRNGDIDLVAILDRTLPAHARLAVGAYQDDWDAASGCHASQQNPRQQRDLLDRILRLILRHQRFTRAYPEPNGRDRMERDLFEGLP
jgi:LmbE family N-acetylglucosaminyl deacetylase